MPKKIWEKPPELEILLDEIQLDSQYSPDVTVSILSSDETEGILTLKGLDAAKVLSSPSYVRDVFNALGGPKDATVEIRNFEISDEVFEEFESLFDYVEVV